MTNFSHKRVAEKKAVERQSQEIPSAVIRAQAMDWGVAIDAYLYDAAMKVGCIWRWCWICFLVRSSAGQ